MVASSPHDLPPSPRLKNPVFFEDPDHLTPVERAALWSGGCSSYLRKVAALALGLPADLDTLHGIPSTVLTLEQISNGD